MTGRQSLILLTCAAGLAFAAFPQDLMDGEASVPLGMVLSRYHMDTYEPGKPLDITITIEGPDLEVLRAMGLEEDLPEDWLLVSVQGDAGVAPDIFPSSGAAPPFDFAWIMPPAPPCAFTYTVMVPESAWGQKELYGVLEYRIDGGALQAAPAVTLLNGPDPQPPTLTLLGNNPMEVRKNTPWMEPGYTAQDHDEQDISGYVLVTGSVNTGEEGTYTLEYRVTSRTSGLSASASRTVTVVEDLAPDAASDPLVPPNNTPSAGRPFGIPATLTAGIAQPATTSGTAVGDGDTGSFPVLPDLSAMRPVPHERPEATPPSSTAETGEIDQIGNEGEAGADLPSLQKKASTDRARGRDRKDRDIITDRGEKATTGTAGRKITAERGYLWYWLIGGVLAVSVTLCGYLVWRLAYRPVKRVTPKGR